MPSLRRLAGRDRPATVAVAVEAPLALLDILRNGPAALTGAGPARVGADRLRVAVVIPPFRRGSGGHATIANLVRGLEARRQTLQTQRARFEGQLGSLPSRAVGLARLERARLAA